MIESDHNHRSDDSDTSVMVNKVIIGGTVSALALWGLVALVLSHFSS